MHLRVIGDVHAQIGFTLGRNKASYLDILSGCEFSVQLGDMGDKEAYEELNAHVDPRFHRFFAGNHDHYPFLPSHSLGDFGGRSIGGVNFFFVRGAQSGDKKQLQTLGKKLGKTLWYEEEQLPLQMHNSIVETYLESKPDLVLSHTCPASIVDLIRRYVVGRSRFSTSLGFREPSDTEILLQSMLERHRPKLWFFGHFHHDWSYLENGTEFRCIGELSFLDLPFDGGQEFQ